MHQVTKDDFFNQNQLTEITAVKGLIQDFLRSVKMPVELIQILKNGILTGGASASLFHGDSPKDWDIYLTGQSDIDSLNKLVTENETILAMIEDINPKYGVDTLVDGKLITPRAITFKNRIQVITMARADARETFDFVHCMPYYNIKETTYHISRRQYESIKKKELIHNPKSPQPATYRRQKFLNRGWHE